MFEETNIHLVLGPAVLLCVMVVFIGHFLIKDPDPLQRAVKRLKLFLAVIFLVSLLLWLSLPMTAVLGTFGYPKTLGDIRSQADLLKYLQVYNKAIVRTTEVVSYFMFVYLWWFVVALWTFLSSITAAVSSKNRNSS